MYEYTLAKRIPAIYEFDPLVRDGGLMSLWQRSQGFNLSGPPSCCANFSSTARGRPTCPSQQPTRYPFVINLKTAKAMNIDIPATLVALADEVIE